MTFTEIVNEVSGRMNLTSTAAIARIGANVNIRNRQVCTALGLDTSGRAPATQAATIGNRYVTFANTLKIFNITHPANPLPLGEITVDEMRNRLAAANPPTEYAIYRQREDSITILLDGVPLTAYVLTADILEKTATLSGSSEPAWVENYHDILVDGAIVTELRKMEKYQMANDLDKEFNLRLNELKYFQAKSGYLSRWAGKLRQGGRGPAYFVVP